jgi:hypothetical protein
MRAVHALNTHPEQSNVPSVMLRAPPRYEEEQYSNCESRSWMETGPVAERAPPALAMRAASSGPSGAVRAWHSMKLQLVMRRVEEERRWNWRAPGVARGGTAAFVAEEDDEAEGDDDAESRRQLQFWKRVVDSVHCKVASDVASMTGAALSCVAASARTGCSVTKFWNTDSFTSRDEVLDRRIVPPWGPENVMLLNVQFVRSARPVERVRNMLRAAVLG